MQMPDKKVFVALFLIVGAIGSLYYTFIGSSSEEEYADIVSESDEESGEGMAEGDETWDGDVDGEDQAGAVDDADPSSYSGRNTTARSTNQSTPVAQGSVADRMENILNKLVEKRRRYEDQVRAAEQTPNETASETPAESSQNAIPRAAPVGVDLLPGYRFTGVLVGEETSCALIGGYILREGDFLPSGHEVVKIFRKSVHLRLPGVAEDIIKFIEPRGGAVRRGEADEIDEEEPNPIEEIAETLSTEEEEG